MPYWVLPLCALLAVIGGIVLLNLYAGSSSDEPHDPSDLSW